MYMVDVRKYSIHSYDVFGEDLITMRFFIQVPTLQQQRRVLNPGKPVPLVDGKTISGIPGLKLI